MEVSLALAGLKSSDPAARAAAAEELAHLEDAAQPAAVALVGATADQDESVRQWATAALESLGPPAVGDVAELAKLLLDKRLDVAYWATTLLGRLESDAAAAVPQLTGALQSHPETAVRERAAWALGQIGPAAAAAVPALNAAVGDGPRLSRLAKESIQQISAANERK
ncbi:MAG TPA: HEAT repeat domain-containing protein [Pirellulales bacterium]|nr:HEAT repeat domain-containing protein [Pirellulales bacterium]